MINLLKEVSLSDGARPEIEMSTSLSLISISSVRGTVTKGYFISDIMNINE